MESITLKLFPTVDSLSSSTHAFTCPSTTCCKLVMSAPALYRHLRSCLGLSCKSSSQRNTKTQFKMEFHCPVDGCNYDKEASRSFSCLKYLKQHYDKVHAEKKLRCESCQQSFSRSYHLDAHLRQCGKQFACSCGIVYSSRQALLMHAKRKRHSVSEQKSEQAGKVQITNIRNPNLPTLNAADTHKPIFVIISEMYHTPEDRMGVKDETKPRLLLPKPPPPNSIPLPMLAAVALSELSATKAPPVKVDIGVQAFPKDFDACGHSAKDTRRTISSSELIESLNILKRKLNKEVTASELLSIVNRILPQKKIRRSAETQTRGGSLRKSTKQQKTSAQTQTLGSQVFRKSAEENRTKKGSCSKSARKLVPKQSIHTQTAALTSTSVDKCSLSPNSSVSVMSASEMVMTCGACFNPKTFGGKKRLFGEVEKNISTDARAAALHLEHISSGTQTGIETLHQQLCTSSSQTERDVFLGHMNISSSYINEPDAHLNMLSPLAMGEQSTSADMMSSDCTTSLSYEDMFSSGSCSCDRMNNSETQTELNLDYLFMCENDDGEARFDDNILCSNIQTQTTDDVDVDFLSYEVLLSNMQTQTSQNHADLLPELTFSDIETQTVCMGTLSVNPEHQLVHIETQTSTEPLKPQSIHTQT